MTSQTVTQAARSDIQVEATSIPELQTQLLLHQAKQPYEIDNAREIPKILPGELLVQVQAVGLNPIDWKSAEYGFALPSFPCVNGREFVGKVIREHSAQRSDIKLGDSVLSICTDYRDFRKSAFQEYAAVNDFSAVKVSSDSQSSRAAAVGVAFVAASIGLGICLGLTFPVPKQPQPLDLLEISRSQGKDNIPEDIFDEVFNAISLWNRPSAGDWILIYGASSVTAQVAIQLAKWGGLRVVAIADREKHGSRLEALGADKIIDRHDLEKAADEIRSEIPMPIRFALDTVGSETSTWCQNVLASRIGVQYRPSILQNGTNSVVMGSASSLPHLVCLTGSPKEVNSNVRVHEVPIKLFHTNRDIGAEISEWLSVLLESGDLRLPETVFVDGGLNAIGSSLQRLKTGELSGKRLVVKMRMNDVHLPST
ncbi:GroES-like protein [Melanomma pulvis-pyrius CBS 109.77]|uniref:GroES-like protein n=1 Tax=Melanomma pulvis-pyrius CBS 109.77 TaxID=1314802 RepID=A0A6A6XAM3_9PLEO|nr:GroES-like protein [Melanomma pulvis-pyrius CBS 109.77]